MKKILRLNRIKFNMDLKSKVFSLIRTNSKQNKNIIIVKSKMEVIKQKRK